MDLKNSTYKLERSQVVSPVSSIYIWSRNLVAQSEASFVLTAHTKTIERDNFDLN
jgi:uncharacterized protein involved in tolerance to divalent cations